MGIKNSEGLTIRQAATALKVSEKTVRRRIDSGQIKFKLIAGKYGNEYRITELPGLDNMPAGESLDKTLRQALDMVSTLQHENMSLAGSLGAAQEKIKALQDQLLLLKEAKKPWYKRLWSSR